jgi:hypothetical protein
MARYFMTSSRQVYRVNDAAVAAWHVEDGWFPSCIAFEKFPEWEMVEITEDAAFNLMARSAESAPGITL